MSGEQKMVQASPIPEERLRCWKTFDWLCKILEIIFTRRGGGDPCVYVPERVINRPDPSIYSQFLLMKLEQLVTRDNPDISIFLDGTEQNSYDLTAHTVYDIAIRASWLNIPIRSRFAEKARPTRYVMIVIGRPLDSLAQTALLAGLHGAGSGSANCVAGISVGRLRFYQRTMG